MFNYRLLIWIFLLHLQLLFIDIVNCSYRIPVPTIEVSSVRGFNVSIPEFPGIAFYEFNGVLEGCSCLVSDHIKASKNGQWTYSNIYRKLEINDTLYYYIIVNHKNVNYRLDQTYRFSGIYDNNNSDGGDEHQKRAPDNGDGCHGSITEVFGVIQCQGVLIFEEQFNTFDDDKWQYAIELDSNDYKFATYQNDSEVCGIENGNFIITPKLFVTLPGKNEELLRGGLDFGRMCTGTNGTEQCIRPASIGSILPPVVSCKIRTKDKFQFKYGRIEIRASLPIGDWIFPELFLDSNRSPFRHHRQFRVGFIRSNEYLTKNGKIISGKRLYGGHVLRAKNSVFRKDRYKNKIMENHFGNDYHVYGLTWTAKKISLYVDGEMYGEVMSEEYKMTHNKLANKWRSRLTSFDREFFISLGVGVGGISDFPDNCLSRNKNKPWVNRDPRNAYRFWNDRDNWYSTWTNAAGDNLAQLKVDYVKVYAI